MEELSIFKENLETEIQNAGNIIIVPHIGLDFDAIGASIALAEILKTYKKSCYVLINDMQSKLDKSMLKILDSIKSDYQILNNEKYQKIRSNDDLCILIDVNKSNLIPIETIEDKTIIIDHHGTDNKTVKSKINYINTAISSASEIMLYLLDYFNIKIDSEIANHLLTGIYLDTNKLTTNITVNTLKAATKLMEYGADMNKVTELFIEDFLSDRKVQDLIDKAEFINFTIAIVKGESGIEYTKEELAKVADALIKYKLDSNPIDASFAIGNIGDNITSISARSKDSIHVGKIMENMQGGGTQYSAATKLECTTPSESYKKLIKVIKPDYYIK